MPVGGGAGGGAVSRRNCSIAATTAAASSGDAAVWRISIRGRGGACLPVRPIAAEGIVAAAMPEIPAFDHDTFLKAVTPLDAIERVRDGFVRHAAREWEMPAKTHLLAPPNGHFRAIPARASGLAMLKWTCSFPPNTALGKPAV